MELKYKLHKIGAYIHEVRLANGLTLREASKELNLHQNTLSRAEHGENITLISLLQIVEFYNLPLSEFENL